MSVPRPFRGVAYVVLEQHEVTGRRRPVAARTARASRESLDRWAAEQLAAGRVVDLVEVLDALDLIDPNPLRD